MIDYYINENEDILITENPPEGFYRLRHLGGGTQTFALYSGLYMYCKASALADYDKHNTAAMAIKAKLNDFGIEIPSHHYMLDLTDYLLRMSKLWLSCLWGNNRRDIEFVKDVLIPNEYIKDCIADYSSAKVDNFINRLVEKGCIKFIKLEDVKNEKI